MKKLLSIISIFLLSTILIACNNNVHKVSGEVLTSNEEITTAFNVVSNMDVTDVLGQTYGLSGDFEIFIADNDEATLDLKGSINLFITLTELLKDFKVFAEAELDGNFEGVNLNGKSGLYITDNRLFADGAFTQIFSPIAMTYIDLPLPITSDEYQDALDSFFTDSESESEFIPEIPFEDDEVFNLLVTHEIITIYKDKEKYSFVFDITIDKFLLLADDLLGDEEVDMTVFLEYFNVLNLNLTLIVNKGKIVFLSSTVHIEAHIYEEVDEVVYTDTNLLVKANLTFKADAKMPKIPYPKQ